MQFVAWIIFLSEFIIMFYPSLDNDYGAIMRSAIRVYCMLFRWNTSEYIYIYIYIYIYKIFIYKVSLGDEHNINAVVCQKML